jgi:ATP-binding cassette subfamily B (MDR/TAP) protein 1
MDRKVPIDEDTTEVSTKRNGNNADDEKLSAFGAYVRLWTYASPLDTVLRIIGCLAGLGAGTAYPLMTIVFGNLINDFNGFALGIVPASKFRSDLNHNSLWFIYLFLGKFGVSSSFPSQHNGYT